MPEITENSFLVAFSSLNDQYEFVSDPENHSKITNLKRRLLDLETLKTQLVEIIAHFNESGVHSLEFESDEEAVVYQFKDVKNKMYDTLAMFDKLLTDAGTEHVEPRSASGPGSGQLLNVKLPTIELPKFSGNFIDWVPFFDTFKGLIHLNCNLTPSQKLHYLKACLDDEPKRTLDSLKINDINYEIALDLLKQRYENKRLVINNHVKNIFDLGHVQKGDCKSLRNFLDAININLNTLKSLKRPVDAWSDLLVHVISSRLDYLSCAAWEESLNPNAIPTHEELLSFLEKRCQMLESMQVHKQFFSKIEKSSIATKNSHTLNPGLSKKRVFYTSRSQTIKKFTTPCFICNKTHGIFSCEDFSKLTPNERFDRIKTMNRCINCFRSNHSTKDCKASGCKNCGKNHHTLLHFENNASTNNKTNLNDAEEFDKLCPSTSHCNLAVTSNILLSTALVTTSGPNGKQIQCRALLDIGSQSHFISERLCAFLNLPSQDINMSILGINGKSNIKKVTDIHIQSRITKFRANLKCLVVKTITEPLPTHTFNIKSLNIPSDLELADPSFHCPGPVDLLIGAELFLDLLIAGKFTLGKNKPTLQNTVFGWILGGALGNISGNTANCFKISLDESIARFWELESSGIGDHKEFVIKPHGDSCETHFKNSTDRLQDGRFQVRLPFCQNPPDLGNSKDMALNRFMAVERKRMRDPKLDEGYKAFMKEYLELGHMERVPSDSSENSFYLPHSCVIKETSATTKFRVVFDGSAKSSNNKSLNDMLLTGPVLQPDLFTIILQFRRHQYVMTADISKMYRCVMMHPDDRRYQKVFWRDNPQSPVETYQLNTVTYGLKPSSFQAIKCIQQIGFEERINYPLAYRVINNNFYVDDALFGSDSIPELISIKEQLKTVLAKGRFSLSKWSSNCPDALQHERGKSTDCLILDKNHDNKTLGIKWNNEDDYFSFTNFRFKLTKNTKRSVMSAISQLFDPLGLINPVVTKAKIIMQQIWISKINWDDELPENLNKAWNSFVHDLLNLNKIHFPRSIVCRDPIKLELHGFCDSSEKAYGAVIFLRSIDYQLNVHVRLVCAKSRVAPLKTISLPRLELCGAVLLANLSSRVAQTYDLLPEHRHYWTDSKIVLAWLAADSYNWKTFVANRVSEVQRLTNAHNWHYVKGTENPADVITRGTNPTELGKISLWFHGPTWLHQINLNIDATDTHAELHEGGDILEQRVIAAVAVQNPKLDFFILRVHSRFSKLVKTVASWKRVITNLKHRVKREPEIKGPLTNDELKDARLRVLQLTQAEAFANEIRSLKNDKSVVTSSIASLNPFLDSDMLIRVGGRLNNSSLPFDRIFPVLLPKHHVTELIIQEAHLRQLHAGQLGTLAQVRLLYWPLSGRNQVRKVIRNCPNCFKVNPKPYHQIMGNLPMERVTSARPFLRIGVDFGGPIMIKEGRGRGKKLIKSYICLFICLSTKAVHLELVGDLTTESFFNALKRLISRRGNISYVISDNATNFTGTRSELAKLLRSKDLQNKIEREKITWKFIPPRAPNFAGLWEAGIKSVKGHIKRVIGDNHLTYEEMYTLLVGVEAVLNSRPLTPLSSDANDLSALTPGHFLIGHPLTAIIDLDHTGLPSNRLSRWQLVEAFKQHIWRRWSTEYLSNLHNRSKWKKPSTKAPQIGTMVLVKEDNLPPLQWRLGRIVEVHPGSDGLVRVVTVKCRNGLFKRAISKICALPYEDNVL
ncbi:uncharacterized protein LOC135139641 [Zophobas morio]|uniref:uncharacterized protein LOC135139641 n=1 Tax=Zophobas morio TaxID=2755281 RepID=UPI0030835D05